MILTGLLDTPILYLSTYITANQPDYYRLLNAVRTGYTIDSWEDWVYYMLDSVEATAKQSINVIQAIRSLMADTKRYLQQRCPKFYSKKLLDLLFKYPYITIGHVADTLRVTRKTARGYLKRLETLSIITTSKIGRNVYFIHRALFKIVTTH